MWNVEHNVHVIISCNHSRRGHEKVVRYMVTEGQANPNVKDKAGLTPLHKACR